MIFESTHVRVTVEHNTATLWLDFPGEPVNALDLNRLGAIDAAIAAVEASPFIDVLVVRSAKPAGFGVGLHPQAVLSLENEADRAAFSWVGQQVFQRVASLRADTIAFIDGPCLGAGLELALACDYRLCLCRPTTHLGFPDAPAGIVAGFGGTVRLRAKIGGRAAREFLASGATLSGREACAIGLVDHAFCERRGKIELRTFLDAIERRGSRVRQSPELAGFAEERRRFAHLIGVPSARTAARRHLARLRPPRLSPGPVNPIPPFPAVVGLLGDDAFASNLCARAAMHGHRVVLAGSGAGVSAAIDAAQSRGFLTPLEAEQARNRVAVADSAESFAEAGVVFVAPGESVEPLADVVSPTGLLVLCGDFSPDDFPSPRRVIGIQSSGNSVSIDRFAETDSDTVASLAAWLRQMAPAFTLSIREAVVPGATRELVAA